MEGACKERHLEQAPAQVGEEVRKVDGGGLVSPYLSVGEHDHRQDGASSFCVELG